MLFSRACTQILLGAVLLASASCAANSNEWTGAYIGGGIGADAATTDIGVTDAASGEGFALDGFGGGDFGATLKAGADWQIADWLVIGAFVDYDWSTIKTTAHFEADDLFARQSGDVKLLDLQHSWAVGGRIGVIVSPHTLAYGLLGYTRAKLSNPGLTQTTEFSDPFEDEAIVTTDRTQIALPTFEGIVFGGGFEHRLNKTISLWAEYRQSQFGTERVLAAGTSSLTLDPTIHIGRVGVSYRFGGADTAAETEAAAAPARNWTGLYAGLGAGVDGITGTGKLAALLADGSMLLNASGKGVGGGDIGGSVLAGYDIELAPFIVAGVSVAYDRSAHDITLSTTAAGEALRLDIPSIGDVWSFAARLGYLVTPDVLAYGMAGYTRVAFSDWTVAFGDIRQTVSSPVYDGFTIGGGFEKLIGSNFSLRAEYRYSALAGKSVSEAVDDPNLGFGGNVSLNIDPSVHTVRLLGVYHFQAP